jgi:hypothetical protein
MFNDGPPQVPAEWIDVYLESAGRWARGEIGLESLTPFQTISYAISTPATNPSRTNIETKIQKTNRSLKQHRQSCNRLVLPPVMGAIDLKRLNLFALPVPDETIRPSKTADTVG